MGCDLLDSITASSPEALGRRATSINFKEFAPSCLLLMQLPPGQCSQSLGRTLIAIFRESLWNWRDFFPLQLFLRVPWSYIPLSLTYLVFTPHCEGQSPHMPGSPCDDVGGHNPLHYLYLCSWLSEIMFSPTNPIGFRVAWLEIL